MHPCRRVHAFTLGLALALLVAFPLDARPQPSEPILTIEAGLHAGSLRSMATDEANRFLVTGSSDKTVRVWDLPSGRLLGILRPPVGRGGDGAIMAVAISPDGSTIACGGRTRETDQSRSIYLFDRESRRMLKRVPGLPDTISYLKFSRYGRVLAAGLSGQGGLRLYSIARKGDRIDVAQIGGERTEGGSVQGIDVDGAGRLAVTSVDGALRLYDRELRLIAKRDLSKEDVPLGVRFSPDGTRIAVGYYEIARVDIFSATDLKLIETPLVARTPHQQPRLLSVAWSLDGRYLYAAGHFSQKGKTLSSGGPSRISTPPLICPYSGRSSAIS
jgi:WD40 repeat protein